MGTGRRCPRHRLRCERPALRFKPACPGLTPPAARSQCRKWGQKRVPDTEKGGTVKRGTLAVRAQALRFKPACPGLTPPAARSQDRKYRRKLKKPPVSKEDELAEEGEQVEVELLCLGVPTQAPFTHAPPFQQRRGRQRD